MLSDVLFRRRSPGVLELWDGRGGAQVLVPWGNLGEPSSLRWCTASSEVLVCAPEAGAPREDYRGRYRPQDHAYRFRPGQSEWRQLSSVYATDAVCLHGEGYALYRGGGLQFLDSDGSVVRQAGAAPRFSGSPSYLAVNHRGDRVAWIRDSRKIQVEAPRNADVSFRSRASAYGYGWWDDGTLLFFYGAGLQLLDLESGTSRALRLDLRSLILDQLTEPGALVRHVSDVGKADTEVTLDDVQVTPDIVWLLARIGHRGTGRQVGALFTIDRASNRLTVQDSPGAHQTLTDFATTTDGSAVTSVSTFDNGRRTGIHLSFTGPSSDLLRDGWRPAPDCTRPTYFSGIYG